MEDDVCDGRPDVEHVNVVPFVAQVLRDAALVHLGPVVKCRVEDTHSQKGRVNLLLLICSFVFDVNEIGIDDEDQHVEEMRAAADHMVFEGVIFPLELDELLDGLGSVYF